MGLSEQHLQAEWKRHLSIIVLAVGVFVFAMLLQVRDDERVALRMLPSLPAPETCPSRTFLHFDCPACGLTRSFVKLAAGDLAGSWQKHRLGWLVAFFVAGQIPYRVFRMKLIQQTSVTAHAARWPKQATLAVIGALLVNWLLKLCGW